MNKSGGKGVFRSLSCLGGKTSLILADPSGSFPDPKITPSAAYVAFPIDDRDCVLAGSPILSNDSGAHTPYNNNPGLVQTLLTMTVCRKN